MSDDDMYDHGEDPMFIEIFGEDTENEQTLQLANAFSPKVIEEETLTYLEWLLAICKYRNGGELPQTAKQLNEYLDCWHKYTSANVRLFGTTHQAGWDQVGKYACELWLKILGLADELEHYAAHTHRMPLTMQ